MTIIPVKIYFVNFLPMINLFLENMAGPIGEQVLKALFHFFTPLGIAHI
jgi:hypothetical protein